MALTTENNLEQRIARVDAAVALRGGRSGSPMVPKIGMAYAQTAGIDRYEALMTHGSSGLVVEKFLQTYPCDLFWAGSGYPIPDDGDPGTTAIRWPGATCGVPSEPGFSKSWTAPIWRRTSTTSSSGDPSHFCMTKVFPRKHKKLAGLAIAELPRGGGVRATTHPWRPLPIRRSGRPFSDSHVRRRAGGGVAAELRPPAEDRPGLSDPSGCAGRGTTPPMTCWPTTSGAF